MLEKKLRFITLTLGDGGDLNRTDYRKTFDCEVEDDFEDPLRVLKENDLLTEDRGQIGMTETGKLMYDLVTRAFYPESVRHWMQMRQPAT